MLMGWLLDADVDLQPVAHQLHVAERYTALRHAPRTGIHAEEQCFRFSLGQVESQIPLCRLLCIAQRVVVVDDGMPELKRIQLAAEIALNVDKLSSQGCQGGQPQRRARPEKLALALIDRKVVSVRNFVCEQFFKNQGIRSLVCERPS